MATDEEQKRLNNLRRLARRLKKRVEDKEWAVQAILDGEPPAQDQRQCKRPSKRWRGELDHQQPAACEKNPFGSRKRLLELHRPPDADAQAMKKSPNDDVKRQNDGNFNSWPLHQCSKVKRRPLDVRVERLEWIGPPVDPPSNVSELAAAHRKYYGGFLCGAKEVHVQDCVELQPYPGETQRRVVRLEALWSERPQDGRERMLATCRRFYFPEVW